MVDPEFARIVVIVCSVALGWDASHLWLGDVVIPSLLLTEVNGILL